MDTEILDRIASGGQDAWDLFLDTYAGDIFRVVRLFARTYDERMDLFLFICDKLREDDMRRVRRFRFRPEAPCRLSTWLAVVARNLAIDHLRERDGRFRPFREVETMDDVDRLVFDYHMRDGRPLDEVGDLLRQRHGLALPETELARRAGRVRATLSPSQRWRLLARLGQRARPVPVDPVTGSAGPDDAPIPLADVRDDPEKSLRSSEAQRALREALDGVPPRQRMALSLRFRDGLTAAEAAAVMHVRPAEADRLAQDAVARLRATLAGSGFASPDFEPSHLARMWPERASG
jgi:RNA polymerase sigma factor (sigma-70 family)